ncbi:MAG TPA: hypothetical protein VJV23_02650, partial [Candidatus Polarisedimenticolia bacterium]|nr:hypothetical protein [Candidatus Polarisedimenticolia bacterium]
NVPGPLRRAPAPFRLAPAGRPEAALAWKSLVRSIRVTSGLPLLAGTIVLGLVPALVLGLRSPGSALPAAGMICASLALVLLWVGPQILGADFASELLHIERLRSYPLSGPAILAGSLLAPVAVLTLLQWGLLGLFWILTLRELELPVDPALPVLAAGLFAPPLTFASALVQTGVTLLAPGWMTPGGGRPGGFESFGFTLVSAVARLVVLGTCVLPGMAVAGLACWAGSVAGSLEAGVAAGGVLGSAVVGAEGALGLALLGRRLERLDPSRELDAVRG